MPPSTTVVKIMNSIWKPRLGSNAPCTTANMIAADAGERAGKHPNLAVPCDRRRCRRPPRDRDCQRPRASTCRWWFAPENRRPPAGDHDGDRDRDRLAGRDPHEAEIKHHRLVDCQLADAGTRDEKHDIAQHQPEPDRDQRGRDQPATRERIQHDQMKHDREPRCRQNRRYCRNEEVEPEPTY